MADESHIRRLLFQQNDRGRTKAGGTLSLLLAFNHLQPREILAFLLLQRLGDEFDRRLKLRDHNIMKGIGAL